MKEFIQNLAWFMVATFTLPVLAFIYFHEPHPGTSPGECVVQRVIDGDTILCRGDLRIRFSSIDAAELDTRRGVISKNKLERVLPVGTKVHTRSIDPKRPYDKYGRLLADIYIPYDVDKDRKLQDTLKEVHTKWQKHK